MLSGDTVAASLYSVTSVDDDHAWAAGKGVDEHGVLMSWDGQTWSPVTDPALPEVQGWYAVSAASADDVWAYGANATSTGGTAYLAHYDGKQWAARPAAGPLDRDWIEVPVKAVPGRVFQGGNALYTYSDGAWQTFSLPDHVDMRGLDALSANDAYAAGMDFPVRGGHPVAYHWDGKTWTLMPQPPAPAGVMMSEVAAVAPDDVYMAGWGYPPLGGPAVPHVDHWDGSSWTDVTGYLSGFILSSLRPDGHGGLWAAGGDDTYPGSGDKPVFWHYDGTAWTKQLGSTVPTSVYPSYYFSDLAPVEARGGTRLLAVGEYKAPASDDPDSAVSHGLIQETQSSLDLTTADVSAGATASHTVHVHAETPGWLRIAFHPADGQPDWSTSNVDLKVTSVTGPRGTCANSSGPVNGATAAVTCSLTAGDYSISYTLTAGATINAWQVVADAGFQPLDADEPGPEATADFAVDGAAPAPATRFLARDAVGTLWRYDGTGNAAAPYDARVAVGNGWQGYNAITALSNLTVHGTGDMVARDTSGVLWYYRGGGDAHPFATRVKIGAGWNIYNSLTGAGDLTGDGRADLLARDTSGVLWLYPGTSSTTAPFAARVKIGAGWNAYNSIAGTGDLTGEGSADLLARDTSGELWLYQGTSSTTAPFAARVKVGAGWGIYNTLIVPGDLTGDGRADILGRDASGALWLYKGTGRAGAPYTARINVGAGWGIYNALI